MYQSLRTNSNPVLSSINGGINTIILYVLLAETSLQCVFASAIEFTIHVVYLAEVIAAVA